MADSLHDKGSNRDLASRLGLNTLTGGTTLTRTHWIWIGVGIVALLIGLRMAFFGTPAPVYLSQPIARTNLEITVSATGTLAPRDQVDVGAEVSGRIDAIYVDFNDRVKKGQKLAKINTLTIEAQLAQSRATLAQAQATLVQAMQTAARTAALARANGASRQALDAANADYARAAAAVHLAQAQVSANTTTFNKATIYSPIDGVVLDRKVSTGQ
ncbi:MAG: efflux RND transporter periplasmic adaptor subunit, partial [Alphaproteobacteria bacterium]|nr:efflux RND transporter periplasmic adaptor subunit [Alphaproteobacteria bacterium]